MPGKRWQVLMVEGGVIVLSILMAFGIDAWWAERQHTRLVRDALTGVADEIWSAESELASNGSVHLRHVQNTAALAETLAVHPAGSTVVVPDSLVAGLFEQYVSDPPIAVVSSFVSAGLVEDLGSLDLRRAILVWITSIQEQRDDQRLAREYGSLEIQAFLRAEFDVTGPQRMIRTMHQVEPTGGTGGRSVHDRAPRLAEIAQSGGLAT